MLLILSVLVTLQKTDCCTSLFDIKLRGLLERGFYCLQNFVTKYNFVGSNAADFLVISFSFPPCLSSFSPTKVFYLFICVFFFSFFLYLFRPSFLQNKGTDLIMSLIWLWMEELSVTEAFRWRAKCGEYHRVLILLGDYHLSLPASTFPSVWAVRWVGYVTAMNELTGSGSW